MITKVMRGNHLRQLLHYLFSSGRDEEYVDPRVVAAAPGDRTAAGEPIWYSGRRLAADLTLPRLRHRWAAASAAPAQPAGGAGRAGVFDEAARAAHHAADVLRGGGPESETTAAAVGDLAAAVARVGSGSRPGELATAAQAVARASRTPWARSTPPAPSSAAALRSAARGLLTLGRVFGRTEGADWARLLAALVALTAALTELREAQQRLAQAVAARTAAEIYRHQGAVAAAEPPRPAPVAVAASRPVPPVRGAR